MGDKQLLQNYRPVSLLPMLGKLFEKILCNNIFEYLQENNFLCKDQSGFQPSDSCEYQFMKCMHPLIAILCLMLGLGVFWYLLLGIARKAKKWICRLLVIHLLLLLNPWLIVEMWLAWVFSIGITLVDVLQICRHS